MTCYKQYAGGFCGPYRAPLFLLIRKAFHFRRFFVVPRPDIFRSESAYHAGHRLNVLHRSGAFENAAVWRQKGWLNLIERWFGELTGKRIRRGVFVSVPDLVASIEEYLEVWNTKPKPFVWTATIESIMEMLTHCKQTLEKIQPGCTTPRSRKPRKNKSSRL